MPKSPNMPKSPKTNDSDEKSISLHLLRSVLAEHAGCVGNCKQPRCRQQRACQAIALGDGRPCESPAWQAEYDRLAERLFNLYEMAFEKEPPDWGLEIQMAKVKFDRLIARQLEEMDKQEAGRRRRRNGRPPVSEPGAAFGWDNQGSASK